MPPWPDFPQIAVWQSGPSAGICYAFRIRTQATFRRVRQLRKVDKCDRLTHVVRNRRSVVTSYSLRTSVDLPQLYSKLEAGKELRKMHDIGRNDERDQAAGRPRAGSLGKPPDVPVAITA